MVESMSSGANRAMDQSAYFDVVTGKDPQFAHWLTAV